jgi:hypothetical protein
MAATTNRKEIKHIIAALQRRYEQWLKDLEAWGETPEQPEPASLGSRVQDLLHSLVGRGGDATPYTWMLAC